MCDKRQPKLRWDMERELEESGRSWWMERAKRHWVLIVEGHSILHFPDRRKDGSAHRDANALACVRRHLRGAAS